MIIIIIIININEGIGSFYEYQNCMNLCRIQYYQKGKRQLGFVLIRIEWVKESKIDIYAATDKCANK